MWHEIWAWIATSVTWHVSMNCYLCDMRCDDKLLLMWNEIWAQIASNVTCDMNMNCYLCDMRYEYKLLLMWHTMWAWIASYVKLDVSMNCFLCDMRYDHTLLFMWYEIYEHKLVLMWHLKYVYIMTYLVSVDRLSNYYIYTYIHSNATWNDYDACPGELCYYHDGVSPLVLTIACNTILRGQYVKIFQLDPLPRDYNNALTLCEVEIYGSTEVGVTRQSMYKCINK